jgi:hypothetical protein
LGTKVPETSGAFNRWLKPAVIEIILFETSAWTGSLSGKLSITVGFSQRTETKTGPGLSPTKFLRRQSVKK